MRLDIWLLKTPHEAYPTRKFALNPITNAFAHRTEPWALRDAFILRQQVSATSHRILHRFTGEIATAKVFRDGPDRWKRRADEFARFGREKVDASLVRYHAIISIDNMPAVITDTYEGLQTYAALKSEIKALHMGSRFLIAAKIQRRLFSALAFLHFHGIVHGAVTDESVLLQLAGHRRAQTVLLVDYSASKSMRSGVEVRRSHALEDGRAAMAIVADCCDIWHVRKAAARNARDERFMAAKTNNARAELDLVKRVMVDLRQEQAENTSRKGQRLLPLLLRLAELKQHAYDRSREDQEHNATRREIGICLQDAIDEAVQDWARSRPAVRIGETAWMHLSLGHPYFDNLANELYHGRWDTTPREVCAQFKALAGDIEDPWQAFTVEKPLVFPLRERGFVEAQILMWMASCCECFPDWRQAIETEYHRRVRSRPGLIRTSSLRKLREALSGYGDLPASIVETFAALLAPRNQHQSTVYAKVSHSVMQHLPSRMFNLTQLQRLANPEHFVACVESHDHGCETFVEVRGEPSLQGCYAPLALLAHFASRLGLSLPDAPGLSRSLPTYDPADFSQVPAGRIVLARTGLVAFASMPRTGNQCDWHAPRKPQASATITSFLLTYFGNMKVLPRHPEGVHEHFRPDHWSGFQTAEELEAAADLGTRTVRLPVEQTSQIQRDERFSILPLLPDATHSDKPPLLRVLKAREARRAEARPKAKRSIDIQEDDDSTSPTAKRLRSTNRSPVANSATATRALTHSFIVRAVLRMQQPPSSAEINIHHLPDDSSFFLRNSGANRNLLHAAPLRFDADADDTVQDGEFDITADWVTANTWLAEMSEQQQEVAMEEAQNADTELLPLFGFRYNGVPSFASTVLPLSSGSESLESLEPPQPDGLRNAPVVFAQGILNFPFTTQSTENAAASPCLVVKFGPADA